MMPLLLAATALAVGCTGGGGATKTPAAPGAVRENRTPASALSPGTVGGKPSNGSGSLIIATLTGMVEYNIKSGTQMPLITPESENTFLLDPAVSPDGKRLVYIVQPPPDIVGGKYDAGSDLWVANRDGSNPHVVYTHAQANQLVRFPQWQDDDNILFVAQEIGLENGVTTVSYVLERIPARGGERVKVLKDVLAFGLSPDRAKLAYARLTPVTGETLNGASIDGTNNVTLIGTEENLAPFNGPRYSPDGKKIAFLSADQTAARAMSPEYVSAAPAGDVRGPALDGLPEDVWTIDAGGGQPVRVADLKEDLPALAWSGDGKHIYVLGAAGLYDVQLETGAVNRLGDGAFHGQLVWVP